LLRGEGGGLNRVVAAGFVVNLSDYSFNGDIAIISHVVATVAGVLCVRVLNCEDKLESRALLRQGKAEIVKPIQLCVECVSEFLS
jgi:hypothetical protein